MQNCFVCVAALALPGLAMASVIVDQQPVSGGGVSRWSQLWQDPGPNGNDLDGDSVCWADFTFSAPTQINHIEWWGTGACELGFRIEIWKQDPGTIAYQPYGVFYYGGDHTVQPLTRFTTTSVVTTAGPGGINHYTLDLANPINVPANDTVNPRWFLSVIGLTQQAYVTWNWSQSTATGVHTFQFIRGSGPIFRSLGESRAMVLGTPTPPCYANCDNSTTAPVLTANDFQCFLNKFAAGDPSANCDGSTTSPLLTANDFQCFLNSFAAGCP